jgi:hypothetical protein
MYIMPRKFDLVAVYKRNAWGHPMMMQLANNKIPRYFIPVKTTLLPMLWAKLHMRKLEIRFEHEDSIQLKV